MTQAKLYPAWQEVIGYAADGPQHKKLIETDEYKAVLVGLEADQQIPPHPATAAAYHFLDGSGWMIVDGERFHVGTGDTVVVPSGVSRGVEAETRLALLGSHGVSPAKRGAFRPFKRVGLMALFGMILMYGLMVVLSLLVTQTSPIGIMFSSGMDLGLAMWGLMVLPFVGLLMMIVMMYIFSRVMAGSNGAKRGMEGHMGLMAQMMGHNHRTQPEQHGSAISTLTYSMPTVNCGHCKTKIEKRVGELTGVDFVHVDVPAKQATIRYDAPATRQEIESVLAEIGHPPERP
jgi:quercetin dioxygenase-like cupin family protein/copper chaperone CopZ